jgi:hypothetical protein
MSKKMPPSNWGLEDTQKYKELQKFIMMNQTKVIKAFIGRDPETTRLVKELNDLTKKEAQKVIESYIEGYSKGYPQYAGHLKLLAKDPYDLSIKSGNEFLTIFIKRGRDIKSSEVQVRKDLINKNPEYKELLEELYTLYQSP